MKWLSDLKLAVVNNNIKEIERLIANVPEITELSDAQETLALIQQSILLVEEEKKKAIEIMNKIKRTKAFLKS